MKTIGFDVDSSLYVTLYRACYFDVVQPYTRIAKDRLPDTLCHKMHNSVQILWFRAQTHNSVFVNDTIYCEIFVDYCKLMNHLGITCAIPCVIKCIILVRSYGLEHKHITLCSLMTRRY